MIRIHNSLTGKKEELRPITPGHVRMYVCGITVYDYLHVGHARMMIVFDMARRHLRRRGLKVTFVQNITDIDDKIIRRAADNNEPIDALTGRFIRAMHEDRQTLGVAPPDHEPRATQYLPEIISMVTSLMERGHAYQASNADVMYAVCGFEGYGRLSGRCLADLRAGARVEVVEAKRDPLDFVLWKAAKPGEPAWDSPWGPGRPGWHIECSAMSTALLGNHFDLHGGGLDLKFPHHENEIAQSCAATGEHFANIWMHNGFVNVDNEKMSKSLGNFFTLREVLPKLRNPEVLRYFFLSSHYRSPINYSLEQLEQADAALGRLYIALLGLPRVSHTGPSDYSRRFFDSMDDDFHTPAALAVLQTLARAINIARQAGQRDKAAALGAELRSLTGVLGIAQLEPAEWFRNSNSAPVAHSNVERLVDARSSARRAKNWKEADRVRAELAAVGVILEDKSDGQTLWRRAGVCKT
jgi:cysteinyl-tRNA synthetase